MIEPTRLQATAPPAAALQRTTAAPAAEKADDKVTWTFEYDRSGLPNVSRIALKGSFDPKSGAFDPNWNQGQTVPMHDDGKNGDRKADDGVFTAQVDLQKGQEQTFRWGAEGNLNGKAHSWLMMTEAPPTFKLDQEAPVSEYAPVSNHLYGVHRTEGDGAEFRTWSPSMGKGELSGYKLHVDLYDRAGAFVRSLPMERRPDSGDWQLELPGQWQEVQGGSYRYSARNEQGELLKTADGKEVSYADPMSRYLQGQQRGVEKIFVEPILGFETGWYNDSSSGGPNYADNPQWGRFGVDGHGQADSVKLVLRDDQGRQLSRSELLERLGEPEFKSYATAPPEDKRDVDVLTRWTMDKSKPLTEYVWRDKVGEDGAISLKKVENPQNGAAWVVDVNNFPKLTGLHYEFQVQEHGKLLGDRNGDGQLQPDERKRTPFNDPYDNKISARPGSGRNTLIRENTFQPSYQDAPRRETDHAKFVIYEAHVGSFMGSKDNALPGTFEDMIKHLDYMDKLGVNAIELMPTAEFGGKKDWGYTPDHYFAGADAYGFEMNRDEALSRGLIGKDEFPGQDSVYINGTDAVKLFVDEAHKRGFNVLADVVYNHTSGRPDGDNPLWLVDGDRRSYFKWNGDHESNTAWGAKPNFGSAEVKQFFTNNSVEQVSEFGYDGIRYDFAQVLHNTGDGNEQIEGMNALRQINRTLQAAHPGAYTVAEDFTGNWLVGADLSANENQGGLDKKGMGFGGVWNDRFRDDVFAAAEGTCSMDRLMESLTAHVGVSGFDKALMYSHSHDEVGNSGQWVGRGAAHSKDDDKVFAPQPRNVSRTIAALNLLGAGTPMIWQGEEFMANNDFKHGLTSTWGHDTDWLEFPVNPGQLQRFQAGEVRSGEEELYKQFQATEPAHAARMAERQGQFQAYQGLIALREQHDAFSATAGVERLYANNADRVLALKRSGGGEEFVVVSNFSDQARHGYGVSLPPGRWKEVFNTDGAAYGGSNTGNAGSTMDASSGLTLPAGGTIVLQKV